MVSTPAPRQLMPVFPLDGAVEPMIGLHGYYYLVMAGISLR
jgi:hypothetical protein